MFKRLYRVWFVLALLLLLPTLTAYAEKGGGEGTPPPDLAPRTPQEQAAYQQLQPPSPKLVEAAQAEKLQYLPMTAAQNDRWEQAFERQMMALRKRLSAKALEQLDIETVGKYIDMQALQKAAGLSTLPTIHLSPQAQQPLSRARHGDFLLGHGAWRPWGYWNHAGMWDAYAYWKTIHARGYGWGVRRDPWYWFAQHYSVVAVMGVWSSSYVRSRSVYYARAQLGEPYTLFTPKWDQNHWYCSKLVWWSYRWASWGYIDLDSNGGYWVTPNNLWYSVWTYVRAIGQGW